MMNNILKFLSLLCMLVPQISHAKDMLFGYVRDDLFHPLAIVDENGIRKVGLSETIKPELITPLLGDSKEKILLLSGKKYKDIYSDIDGKYYELDSSANPTGIFYMADVGTTPVMLQKFNENTIKSFYKFFSNESWGKHFISKSMLNLPVEKIEKQSNIKIHAVTDVDNNKYKEVWVSYKLMYGEVGAMVYEETKDKGWKSIANHCFNCD